MSNNPPPDISLTALVPIKGDSERVPGKNVRDFCGRPLMCRVLEMLQQCVCVGRIVVNTDSGRVAETASAFGKATVHKRPAGLCGHTVSMNSVIAHDLSLLGEGHYLQTHVTSPLLTCATVRNAARRYFTALPVHDSLFSVISRQGRFFDADGRPINHDPAVLLNTQDLPPIYEENSCLYIFSRASFFAGGQNRVGVRPAMFPMLKTESQDIDTEDDFTLAEHIWRHTRGETTAWCNPLPACPLPERR
jgi:CMP-N-acetylneuraminic acid synthetase